MENKSSWIPPELIIFAVKTLIYICSAYLSFSVDANDSTGGFMRSSYKDCVATDSVHVDACSRLNVVQVNITVLGDQIDDVIFRANLKWNVILANEVKPDDKESINKNSWVDLSAQNLMYLMLSYLHSNREVILSFWWKEHVDCFLLVGLVTLWWSADLNDMQLKRIK